VRIWKLGPVNQSVDGWRHYEPTTFHVRAAREAQARDLVSKHTIRATPSHTEQPMTTSQWLVRSLVLMVALTLSTTGAHAATNPANGYLLSIAPAAQAAMLGEAVGTGCAGRTAFYMGIGETGFAKDKAFWSLRCSDGREFEVEVDPNGSGKIVECTVMKALHAGSCFKKLDP